MEDLETQLENVHVDHDDEYEDDINQDDFESENDEDEDDGEVQNTDSLQILSQKFAVRDQVKRTMLAEERQRRLQKQRIKKSKVAKWQSKTKRSPFMVNLVAENERIDEEHRIRQRDENNKLKQMEKRKQMVKNNILAKALNDASDLDILREEKRMIQMEERRLKALLDLEKTNASRKSDLLAAKNAETQRKKAKSEHRRKIKQKEMNEREETYKQLLKHKLAIE